MIWHRKSSSKEPAANVDFPGRIAVDYTSRLDGGRRPPWVAFDPHLCRLADFNIARVNRSSQRHRRLELRRRGKPDNLLHHRSIVVLEFPIHLLSDVRDLRPIEDHGIGGRPAEVRLQAGMSDPFNSLGACDLSD